MHRVIEITENDAGWSKQALLDARVQKATQKETALLLFSYSCAPTSLCILGEDQPTPLWVTSKRKLKINMNKQTQNI